MRNPRVTYRVEMFDKLDNDSEPFAFWLDRAVLKDPVFRGIVEVDRTDGKDKEQLIDALKASGSDVLFYLGDMLQRFDLVKKIKKGNSAFPAYNRSTTEVSLMLAAGDVKYRVSEGVDRDEAIALALNAVEHSITKERLIAFMDGRDGHTRKMNKSRPRSIPF